MREKKSDMTILKDCFQETLDKMTERNKNIMIYMFGLEDGYRKTVDDVCEKFKITRERVRQLEAKMIKGFKCV